MNAAVFEKLMDRLKLRKQGYVLTFNNESVYARRVIKDLAVFCRANASTYKSDSRDHAVLEGRREVWLRIQQYLQLTPEQLLEILKE